MITDLNHNFDKADFSRAIEELAHVEGEAVCQLPPQMQSWQEWRAFSCCDGLWCAGDLAFLSKRRRDLGLLCLVGEVRVTFCGSSYGAFPLMALLKAWVSSLMAGSHPWLRFSSKALLPKNRS